MTWGPIPCDAGTLDFSEANLREVKTQKTLYDKKATALTNARRQLLGLKLHMVFTRKPLNPFTEGRKTQEIQNYFCGTQRSLGSNLPSYSLRTKRVRDRSTI